MVSLYNQDLCHNNYSWNQAFFLCSSRILLYMHVLQIKRTWEWRRGALRLHHVCEMAFLIIDLLHALACILYSFKCCEACSKDIPTKIRALQSTILNQLMQECIVHEFHAHVSYQYNGSETMALEVN